MNFSRLESRVRLDEGYHNTPYLDTVGVATIGYGTTKILDRPVQLTDKPITESIARQLLRQDLFTACIDAEDIFMTLNEMNDVRQEVLVNMAYNLGHSRLSEFRKMIEASNSLNYIEMANQMKDSKWFTQVGQRGLRLYYAMREGKW